MSSRVNKPKEKRMTPYYRPIRAPPLSFFQSSARMDANRVNNNACGPVNGKKKKNEHETDRAMKGKYAAYTEGEHKRRGQGNKQGETKKRSGETKGRLSLSSMHDDWSQSKVVKKNKMPHFSLTCSMLSSSPHSLSLSFGKYRKQRKHKTQLCAILFLTGETRAVKKKTKKTWGIVTLFN